MDVESRFKLFIEKANKVHDNKYDYSKVNYKNSYTKVKIICPIHGCFDQLPQHHVAGSNCPLCAKESASKKKLIGINEFINRSRKVHNDKYDYSKAKYNGCLSKILIICPTHGEFWQVADEHLRGHGCPQCGRERSDFVKFLSKEEFISKANDVHNNKYDYSKTKYVDTLTEVTIICPTHGEFTQKPKNHIQGHGCDKCFTEVSGGHQELIDFIRDRQEIIVNDKDQIAPFELDIYIPSKRLAIEFNGLYWHSFGRNESFKEKRKHSLKSDICSEHNIRLIQIFENEWVENRSIVESILKSKIGISDRIYARKCSVVELNLKDHEIFMNQNHIQGNKGHSVAYGLKYQNEFAAVMSFNRHPKYGWEITRFANKIGYTVAGGASKLFKKFLSDYNPEQILTYADRRYSDGNLYKKLGFDLVGITKPNYFYIKRGVVYSRQQFQKHKLKDKLESFDPNLTEAENMFNNGYRRIWDAGHYKFIFKSHQK